MSRDLSGLFNSTYPHTYPCTSACSPVYDSSPHFLRRSNRQISCYQARWNYHNGEVLCMVSHFELVPYPPGYCYLTLGFWFHCRLYHYATHSNCKNCGISYHQRARRFPGKRWGRCNNWGGVKEACPITCKICSSNELVP